VHPDLAELPDVADAKPATDAEIPVRTGG